MQIAGSLKAFEKKEKQVFCPSRHGNVIPDIPGHCPVTFTKLSRPDSQWIPGFGLKEKYSGSNPETAPPTHCGHDYL